MDKARSVLQTVVTGHSASSTPDFVARQIGPAKLHATSLVPNWLFSC